MAWTKPPTGGYEPSRPAPTPAGGTLSPACQWRSPSRRHMVRWGSSTPSPRIVRGPGRRSCSSATARSTSRYSDCAFPRNVFDDTGPSLSTDCARSVHGHEPVKEIERTANRLNIDTGAGIPRLNRLTLLEVNQAEIRSHTFDVDETGAGTRQSRTTIPDREWTAKPDPEPLW